jgi:hypothetical protein
VGHPADWLATDAPVPFSLFRSIECWFLDAWVGVDAVTDAEFAASQRKDLVALSDGSKIWLPALNSSDPQLKAAV